MAVPTLQLTVTADVRVYVYVCGACYDNGGDCTPDSTLWSADKCIDSCGTAERDSLDASRDAGKRFNILTMLVARRGNYCVMGQEKALRGKEAGFKCNSPRSSWR